MHAFKCVLHLNRKQGEANWATILSKGFQTLATRSFKWLYNLAKCNENGYFFQKNSKTEPPSVRCKLILALDLKPASLVKSWLRAKSRRFY